MINARVRSALVLLGASSLFAACPALGGEPTPEMQYFARMFAAAERQDQKAYCDAMTSGPAYAGYAKKACLFAVQHKLKAPEDCSPDKLEREVEADARKCLEMSAAEFGKAAAATVRLRGKFIKDAAAKGVDGEKLLQEAASPAASAASKAADVAAAAFALRLEGQYAKALPLYRQVLRDAEAARDPAEIALALEGLGQCLDKTGAFVEAEPYFRRALAINEERLGPADAGIAANLNWLAGVLTRAGRYGEAEPAYRRSLALREKVVGATTPAGATSSGKEDWLFYASSLNNLAALLSLTGRHDEAETLFRRALAVEEKVLGPGHRNVADTLDNLGRLLARAGRPAESADMLGRASAIRGLAKR